MVVYGPYSISGISKFAEESLHNYQECVIMKKRTIRRNAKYSLLLSMTTPTVKAVKQIFSEAKEDVQSSFE